ncbi:MAG: NAD-dependent epimerase/dehydratase family protein, partial [Chloroflexota bacterium]
MNEQKDTILVTGSSGRIGYPVAKRLAEAFNVVGFDRRAPSHPPPSAECLYVDLTLEESVRRGLQSIRDLHGSRIASVIHLAAYYDFSGAPSPLYDEITVRGTERLLRMLQDFDVEQFIFSSTDLVYASSAPGQHINEESPLDPKWPYPQSKVETEKVIHAERGNIPTVILRIAGVYDDLCHSIPLAQQLQRIYEHDITAYLFPGDITAGRQAFVHNEDVVDSILSAVARRRELPPEVMLLIGESESLSYDELQRSFGKLIHGVEWKTHSLPNPLAKVGAWAQEKLPLGRPPFIKPWMIDLANDNSELDITRAATVLGWEPKHSLRETLPKMVPALKADPWTWYRENEINPPLWLRELAPTEPAIALGSHELMQLNEQMQREIAATASPPMTVPPKHDMSKMGGSNGNGSMTMDMGQSDEDDNEVRDKAEHLERLRVWQAQLEQAYQREVTAQKKEDVKAQKLMESDPRGHVEMMKMEQEHRQLTLELPRALLQREAEVHQELLQAQAVVSARMPDTGIMMGQMVTMARWSQIPLLALGAWLIVSPFMLDYGSVPLRWSDIISGLLVMTFGVIAFHTGRIWAAVASMLVGLWIAFAPLALWAPNAAVYANDTLVGTLVVVFAFVIPMLMPMSGPTVP